MTRSIDCPSCYGLGGTFEDRWDSRRETHYTEDAMCVNCDGEGTIDVDDECDETEVA